MQLGENYVDDKGVVNLQIMVVEDEFIIALDLKETIKNLGFDVSNISVTGKEAIKAALEKKPDLILMDIMLKGEMSGIEAAGEITKQIDIPIVFVSSFSDEKSIKKAKKISAYGYLVKPYSIDELRAAIEEALRKFEESNYKRYMPSLSNQYTRH